jgi:hypothetical protein
MITDNQLFWPLRQYASHHHFSFTYTQEWFEYVHTILVLHHAVPHVVMMHPFVVIPVSYNCCYSYSMLKRIIRLSFHAALSLFSITAGFDCP